MWEEGEERRNKREKERKGDQKEEWNWKVVQNFGNSQVED